MLENDRLIKQFQIDNSRRSFVHPLFSGEYNAYDKSMNIYLLTLGHLWLYKIVEVHGNSTYLNELLKYAEQKETALFEWELDENIAKDVSNILVKYQIDFVTYLDENFDIKKYDKIIEQSKNKGHLFHTLTRALILAKFHNLSMLMTASEWECVINWEEKTCLVNTMFLSVWYNYMEKGNDITPIPEFLVKIVEKNMDCYTHPVKIRYYPQVDYILGTISATEKLFGEKWYLIPDDCQVLLSKFLYSLRLVKEISINPIGLNGILSAFVTRTLFDNLWQTKYLISENKINDYRLFALDRMRLHVIKRSDMPDVNRIDDLLSEIESGVFDPIPINGDYFTKSAREYAIKLDLKDEYDKYYEYNSEFIHASLTAVYSGIMCKCDNPEHNMHLTISQNGSSFIDCAKHIFEIVNMHADILNAYFEDELCPKFDLNKVFFADYTDYKEFIQTVKSNI